MTPTTSPSPVTPIPTISEGFAQSFELPAHLDVPTAANENFAAAPAEIPATVAEVEVSNEVATFVLPAVAELQAGEEDATSIVEAKLPTLAARIAAAWGETSPAAMAAGFYGATAATGGARIDNSFLLRDAA